MAEAEKLLKKIERRLQPERSVVQFLQAGRRSHPDEADVQAEYDIMLRAVQTGEGIPQALRIARSHLEAHRRALQPEYQGTKYDPYPGQPWKNKAAVSGFLRVVALLTARQKARATQ